MLIFSWDKAMECTTSTSAQNLEAIGGTCELYA
jgi:hypothetical protein